MTLTELAKLTGFTKSLVSKIENRDVSPPIGTLSKLARALDVPITEFFETDHPQPEPVFFPKDKRKLICGPRKILNYAELLIWGRKRRNLQPMLIYVDGQTHKFALQGHPGEKFIMMLEGVMGFVVGNKTYTVSPGDCLHFDARVPHGARLEQDQKGCYVVVHLAN